MSLQWIEQVKTNVIKCHWTQLLHLAKKDDIIACKLNFPVMCQLIIVPDKQYILEDIPCESILFSILHFFTGFPHVLSSIPSLNRTVFHEHRRIWRSNTMKKIGPHGHNFLMSNDGYNQSIPMIFHESCHTFEG